MADLEPNWDDRTSQINNAYNTAMGRLNTQQGNLFSQYGYKVDAQGNAVLDANGNPMLDTGNTYGLIQRQLGQEGTGLDDAATAARDSGLSGTSGLGAQRSSLVRYLAGATQADMARAFTGSNTGILNQEQDAGTQHTNDLSGVASAKAAWLAEHTPAPTGADAGTGSSVAGPVTAPFTGSQLAYDPNGNGEGLLHGGHPHSGAAQNMGHPAVSAYNRAVGNPNIKRKLR